GSGLAPLSFLGWLCQVEYHLKNSAYHSSSGNWKLNNYEGSMLTPVLLCGGVGSRLWPVSRELYPKQFLPLVGDLSMLQETLIRTSELPTAEPVVVCNEEHRFMVAEQLRQVGIVPGAL